MKTLRETDPRYREELASAYLRSWPAGAALLRQHPDLSNPLLLDPPVGYWRQPTRLMVVGQETGPSRWCSDLDVRRLRPYRLAVATLMQRYQAFAVGTGARGHFWRFVRQLEDSLGLESGSAVWTNLNKCDLGGRRPRGLESDLAEAFPLLSQELGVVQPDLVVFLTGPGYDGLIGTTISGRIEPLRGWPSRLLARVRGDGLPEASFRTYHPNYLLRFCGHESPRVVRRLAYAATKTKPRSGNPR